MGVLLTVGALGVVPWISFLLGASERDGAARAGFVTGSTNSAAGRRTGRPAAAE